MYKTDIYKYIDSKIDYFSLFLCISLLFFAVGIQFLLPFTVNKMFVSDSIMIGCLMQFQLLFSIFIIIRGGKFGYRAETIINDVAAIISILFIIILKKELLIQTLISSVLTSFCCTFLFRYVTTIRDAAYAMYKRSITDDLTGLMNHKNFELAVEELVAKKDSKFSIVFIDVDNFKRINDTLGHRTGDNFLVETVRNMLKIISPSDTLGRMGGDEFALLIPGNQTDTEIYRYVKRIADTVHSPFICRNKEYIITASLGIARYPKDAKTSEEIINLADMAMYRAKSLGKNKIVFFGEEMQDAMEKRILLENALQTAIVDNEMYLEYQPQYSVEDKSLRGYEAFIRWDSKSLGRVNPGKFLGVAEETGSMVAIGEWIIKTACADYMRKEQNNQILSINISTVQLNDPGFVAYVESVIMETGINPSCLEFEVTEKICELPEETVVNILGSLKGLGVRISLDDFGTGNSSLNNLRKLPLDSLKIDTSFTRLIIASPKEGELIKPIIEMAHNLGLKVIAEGVETMEELKQLSSYGCDFAQGFLFGRASSIDSL